MNPDDLCTIADRVLNQAQPGEHIEVVAQWSRDTDVRAYGGAVEAFTSAESAGIGIRIVADQRVGFAWAGTFDESAIAETLADARDNVRYASVDPHAGLALPDGVAEPVIDLADPRLAEVDTATKIALALDLEAAILAADPRISGIESVEYGDQWAVSAIVSTEGVRATSTETAAALSAYVLAGDDTETTTGFGFSVARHPDDLVVAAAAADAVGRAVRMLGARPIPSERLTVVLDPWVTAQLIGLIAGVFAGDAVMKGRSLFANRLGESVASPLVTLVDDPTDARHWGAATSDAEGLATRSTTLIDAGVASAFLHDSVTARAFNTGSTGSAIRAGFMSTPTPGPQAVSLRPGTLSPETIRAQVGNGLLIQDVAGLHSGVNPISGDFSTGADGVMIRNGELAEPVREVTIASTLQRMLSDVVAVGSDVEFFPMDAAGVSIAISDVTVSGGGG